MYLHGDPSISKYLLNLDQYLQFPFGATAFAGAAAGTLAEAGTLAPTAFIALANIFWKSGTPSPVAASHPVVPFQLAPGIIPAASNLVPVWKLVPEQPRDFPPVISTMKSAPWE
jgi:hypothetical protein